MPAEARHPVLRGVNARQPAVLVGAGIALLAVLGVVLWLLLRGGGGNATSSRASAEAMSIRDLDQLAGSLGHPVYWAGSQPRFTYEVTRTKDGRVYIRYLPPGATVGTKARYLTSGISWSARIRSSAPSWWSRETVFGNRKCVDSVSRGK